MKEDTLVSIVIASYNSAEFLPYAIRSALEQTYRNIEVHVVDDGSTDNTPEAVAPFLSDSRVNYYHQENKGQPFAKNKGIRESRGDFIAFIDADDVWLKDKIEKQLPCFDRGENIGVVYTRVELIDQKGNIIVRDQGPDSRYLSGKITGPLLIENFITGPTSMIRRECFDKVGLFDESIPMGIDYDLWLRISTAYEFVFLNEVTYQYRIWPGQMSHRWKKRFECGKFIMEKFLKDNNHLLEKDIVDEAWAHTYVGRGFCLANIEKQRFEACKSYITALKYKPGYSPAWKAMIRLIVR